MMAQTTSSKLTALVHGHLPLATALALYLAWTLCIRFSDQLLRGATDQGPSCTFTFACVLAFSVCLVGMIALCRRYDAAHEGDAHKNSTPSSVRDNGHPGAHDGDALPVHFAIWSAVLAAVATLLPLAQMGFMVIGIACGILTGASLAGATVLAMGCYVRLGFRRALALLACALPCAVLLFALFSVACPRWFSPADAVLPLAAALLATCTTSGRVDLREGGAALRRGGISLPKRSAASMRALLLLATFLAVYMPAMYPRTTQLASVSSSGAVGGASISSLACLVLLTILVMLICAMVLRGRANVFASVFLGLALLAASFFLLSTMEFASFALVVIAPIAAMCAVMAYAAALGDPSLVRPSAKKGAVGWVSLLAMALAGAILAAGFAFAFLGLLYSKRLFQNVLFAIIPAVLLVTVVSLLAATREAWVPLVAPAAFSQRLDTSSMENRCTSLAEEYRLTKRELDVLLLLAQGRNEPYIGEVLSIGRTTVKTHIGHIYDKLGVSSRQELIDLLRG